MSEDRLDSAVQGMRDEAVDAATLEAARARVWSTLTSTAGAGCAEFRPDFPSYLGGTLTGGRRVLLEDHVGRCAACRHSICIAAPVLDAGSRREMATTVISRDLPEECRLLRSGIC